MVVYTTRLTSFTLIILLFCCCCGQGSRVALFSANDCGGTWAPKISADDCREKYEPPTDLSWWLQGETWIPRMKTAVQKPHNHLALGSHLDLLEASVNMRWKLGQEISISSSLASQKVRWSCQRRGDRCWRIVSSTESPIAVGGHPLYSWSR